MTPIETLKAGRRKLTAGSGQFGNGWNEAVTWAIALTRQHQAEQRRRLKAMLHATPNHPRGIGFNEGVEASIAILDTMIDQPKQGDQP